MRNSIPGVSALDLSPGEYAIDPSEFKQDLTSLTDDGGEDDVWHVNDVKDGDGTVVLEVYDDRREMEGLSVSGRQFLFRTPDGEPVMAFDREGFSMTSENTLHDVSTGDELGSWKASSSLFSRYELRGPEGETVATAKRKWGLKGLFYPRWVLSSSDGTEIGRMNMNRGGLNYEMDVTLERSSIPTEVLLAWGFGVFWAASES